MHLFLSIYSFFFFLRKIFQEIWMWERYNFFLLKKPHKKIPTVTLVITINIWVSLNKPWLNSRFLRPDMTHRMHKLNSVILKA